ncbi:class I SAM-dependent methyltransferase [Blastopirellula sp. JC732]|uniref:Class I SAM-dependent methyltransferase n=1 Tax=Blastopirellula sediminis TaxID=2894196 RepID=A0A9X1MS92_9BACT|nr:class I SAM-dependent methyltransferase [Blastopirellula sediminis]MCC9606007.1 class I SAM-dependent methyltransferase [Blastopirellula sediminis]MCC9630694.1 class I SAM-dependent methyltransferase [Blastopirellula sediminis]
MFTPDQYQLLDFGDGRKLERFGPFLLDRLSPSAETSRPAQRPLWREAACRYERTDGDRGVWRPADALPSTWTISHGPFSFELKPTDFGHLGIFPEQAENWDWIAKTVATRPSAKVLNLFAYTGGSTLAAAAAGAEVAHVDAAKNVVQWARRNAEISGLTDAPIRWIADDARKFVRREVKRGSQYDLIILDPPSYGHGVKGEVWRVDQHLPELLAELRTISTDDAAILLTCHSPGLGPVELRQMLERYYFERRVAGLEARPLFIPSADDRRLPSGILARWSQ